MEETQVIFGELKLLENEIAHGKPSVRIYHRAGVLWGQLAIAAALWPRWGKRRSERFAAIAEARFVTAISKSASALLTAAIACDRAMNTIWLERPASDAMRLTGAENSLLRLLDDPGFDAHYAGEIRHQLGICLDFLARCAVSDTLSEGYARQAAEYFALDNMTDGDRARRSFLLARALRQKDVRERRKYALEALRSARVLNIRRTDPQYIRAWMIYLFGRRGEWLARRLQHPFA